MYTTEQVQVSFQSGQYPQMGPDLYVPYFRNCKLLTLHSCEYTILKSDIITSIWYPLISSLSAKEILIQALWRPSFLCSNVYLANNSARNGIMINTELPTWVICEAVHNLMKPTQAMLVP